MDGLESLFNKCTEIREASGCDRCPIRHNCLDDTSVSEFIDTTTKGSFIEFYGFADDVEAYANEQDRKDYLEELNDSVRREVERWTH